LANLLSINQLFANLPFSNSRQHPTPLKITAQQNTVEGASCGATLITKTGWALGEADQKDLNGFSR
jgi:hypothetical protein